MDLLLTLKVPVGLCAISVWGNGESTESWLAGDFAAIFSRKSVCSEFVSGSWSGKPPRGGSQEALLPAVATTALSDILAAWLIQVSV